MRGLALTQKHQLPPFLAVAHIRIFHNRNRAAESVSVSRGDLRPRKGTSMRSGIRIRRTTTSGSQAPRASFQRRFPSMQATADHVQPAVLPVTRCRVEMCVTYRKHSSDALSTRHSRRTLAVCRDASKTRNISVAALPSDLRIATFLIDTPAIRNRFNPLKTKHDIFSNRHSPQHVNLHQNRALRAASSPSKQETGIPARAALSRIGACMGARECDITARSAARRETQCRGRTSHYRVFNFEFLREPA
jgi:hypothetical protein